MFRKAIEIVSLAATVGVAVSCGWLDVAAQTEEQIAAVMPRADRFEALQSDLPIRAAYLGDNLIGYVFRTDDWPPQRFGYSGPIPSLVGLDLNGRITGVRVLEYFEAHRNSLGDFLRRDGVQEQFAGKHIADPFVVREDIEGISRATVSVRALARGVRDSARRVAEVYLSAAPPIEGSGESPEILSWFNLLRNGVVVRMEVSDESGTAVITLAHIMNDVFGERFVGATAMEMIGRAVDRRDGDRHVFVYAVDGPPVPYFNRTGWSIVQGRDTVPVEESDVFSFGLASEGMLDVEVGTGGAILVDRVIDLEKPFNVVFVLDSLLPPFEVEYVTLAARGAPNNPTTAVANNPPSQTVEPSAASVPDPEEIRPSPNVSSVPELSVAVEPVDTAERVDTVNPEVNVSPLADPGVFPIVSEVEEQTELERVFAETSFPRLGTTLLVLVLAGLAFALKSNVLNWTALSVTLVFLGFVDGGFLSVSHITSGIWSGAAVYLGDLSLLAMVVFTVVSTLLFGRVFCGFLCPFGALQDFLTKFVPKRFQMRVSWPVHNRAVYLKYVILAVVLIPALLGNRTSIYQFVEPFGTVFYQSPSALLWVISAAFLMASAVVPRFYCRYVCPLGAALAIGSLASIKRIGRVKQCDRCKVCEQACPTAAIQGPTIDFKECVRCNICEIKLNRKAGVCRHSMEKVEARLVRLTRNPQVEDSVL